MTTTTAFGPESLRARSRDMYVGNECDTDQYGETQPTAGMQACADLLVHLEALDDERHYAEAIELIHAWLGERVGQGMYGYAGADALEPILAMYHDVLWDRGQNPYYTSVADLEEFLAEAGA